MRQELDRTLCSKFPNLYRQRGLNMRETAMCWGFECSDGWFEIIYKLSEVLEKLILELPEDQREYYCASQVKEKFATLSFYMHGATNEMWDYIEDAERASAHTCEHCGKPGQTRGGSWLLTLCDPCHHADVADRVARICRCAVVQGTRTNYKNEVVPALVYENEKALNDSIAVLLRLSFAPTSYRHYPGRGLVRWAIERVTSLKYRAKYLLSLKEAHWFFKFYWKDITEPVTRYVARSYRRTRRKLIDFRNAHC